MAYCLRSLVQTLEQVLNPHQHHKNWVLDNDNIRQIKSLLKNASFLRDFLDESSPLIQDRIAGLEDQIMGAAEKAEDTLESHITGQILSTPEGQSVTISPPDLGEVIRAFEAAKEEVIKIMDVGQRSNDIVPHPISSTRYPNSKNVVVGVTGDLIQLKSRLTARASSKLEIIPIVGMGGTGKTTLARILYDEFSSSKSHFDCCGWVTVSQSYNPQRILQTILACLIGKPLNEMPQQEYKDLIVTLHKILVSRRYLIVLDDIWSGKVWDDVQTAFPRDDQGSRVILTTRENTVVNHVKSNSHEMHLINEDDSWELVRKIVFGEESCPRELDGVGKRIAKNCGGLPLALQVIGGLLSHSQRNKDFWDHVANNVRSLIATSDDQFSGIFSWSFAHLPHYLKPCFLYMGAFPEDHAIRASKIIKLWVAEGFLYPIQDKSLEEVAEIHLNALVDRNLIFVRERKHSGKVKSYGIHDLLRDLCLRKARDKKFLYVKDSKTNIQNDTICPHRVSVHLSDSDEDEYEDEDGKEDEDEDDEDEDEDENGKEDEDEDGKDNDKEHFLSLKLTSVTRSFLLIGYTTDKILSCLCFKLSLLRVLDVFQVYFAELPEVIPQLVNLRYLAISVENDCLHSSISILRNLQTLIVVKISIGVIVDLPQLRHLKFFQFVEKYGFPYDRFSGPHENLQRLPNIKLDTLLELRGKFPNLRKLGFYCSGSIDNVDLTCFHNLETLRCNNGFSIRWGTLISNIIFPDTLKKLTLASCGVPQTLIDAMGALPNLQSLIFTSCGFESTTWEPSEDEFCELQYLQFSATNLENWLATEFHFPVLRHLFFDQCDRIREIPNDIGGIQTLETIEVDRCKPSVFQSAMGILEEQRQFGNNVLQLKLGKAQELVRISDRVMQYQEVSY